MTNVSNIETGTSSCRVIAIDKATKYSSVTIMVSSPKADLKLPSHTMR